jgi:hypothetical protein
MKLKDEALDFHYFDRSIACPRSKTSGKAARQLQPQQLLRCSLGNGSQSSTSARRNFL